MAARVSSGCGAGAALMLQGADSSPQRLRRRGAERQLRGAQAPGSSAGAQLLCTMWGLPGSGTEPVSPAVAGAFFTTEPPGRPLLL